ncbi:MAG: SH3 domain-containing protein [Alistipes sp.]|nr:SH3 domain-containing protein [Alistipes sp.]
MGRLAILFVSALHLAGLCCGQGFGYIIDRELMVFLRENGRPGAPVVDTLYNLQIIRTGEQCNGWVEILGREQRLGWVDKENVVPMPAEAAAFLDTEYTRWDWPRMFLIAGTDLPQVVIAVSHPAFHTAHTEKGEAVSALTVMPGESAGAYNAVTGREILDWDIPLCLSRVEISHGRTLLWDRYAQYCFLADSAGRPCLSIIPTASSIPESYTPEETQEALRTARELLQKGERLDPEAAWDLSYEMIGVTNMDFIGRLRAAYFAGDADARETYPAVLGYMIWGGDPYPGQELEREIYVHRNAGVTEIE